MTCVAANLSCSKPKSDEKFLQIIRALSQESTRCLRDSDLISTVALARCQRTSFLREPFQRFSAPGKPLKRLGVVETRLDHRAEATVLMRRSAGFSTP